MVITRKNVTTSTPEKAEFRAKLRGLILHVASVAEVHNSGRSRIMQTSRPKCHGHGKCPSGRFIEMLLITSIVANRAHRDRYRLTTASNKCDFKRYPGRFIAPYYEAALTRSQLDHFFQIVTDKTDRARGTSGRIIREILTSEDRGTRHAIDFAEMRSNEVPLLRDRQNRTATRQSRESIS